MTYLARSAHCQLGALGLALIGCMLTAVALGLVQWRVWLVPSSEAVTSGVAWVGVWRVCFHTHGEVSGSLWTMHCSRMGLSQPSTPPEVAAAQVLLLLALLVGLSGNAAGAYVMRNAYFGLGQASQLRAGFIGAGALCLLAAALALVPLTWNLNSVLTNQTVEFPPEFKLPKAPRSQHAGSGIIVALLGAALTALSGVLFCSYRLPGRGPLRHSEPGRQQAPRAAGKENPVFELSERL